MLRGRRLLLSVIGIVILAAATFAVAALLPKYFQNLLVEHRDIRFASRDAELAGTIYLPRLRRAVAAVVLVHGSIVNARMSPLAERLVKEGFAVLTYDKRGTGESTGVVDAINFRPENLEYLADDAAAALETLVHELLADTVPAGYLGISQAGWIIPKAATKNHDARFMVLLSGPVVTTHEQLTFQGITGGAADFWKSHTQSQVDDLMRSSPVKTPIGDTDPREALRNLSIPGLWVFGSQDSLVPTELSIKRLTALASESKSPFEYRVFPEYGHAPIKPDVLAVMFDWIRKTTASLKH